MLYKFLNYKPWRHTKRYLTIKSIMLQQRGQMRVTRVVFSVSPNQVIVKYVFDLLLVDCCMKLVYFIVCIYLCDSKKMWVNWWKIASKENMAAMTAMAVMATMAAMAKTMLTIKNFVITRRVFLNQVPQKTSMLATSFYATSKFIIL